MMSVNGVALQWIYSEPHPMRFAFKAAPPSEPKSQPVFETEICDFFQDCNCASLFSAEEQAPWSNPMTCILF
jgi:hypothetical protein